MVGILISFLTNVFLNILFNSMGILNKCTNFIFKFVLTDIPICVVIRLVLCENFSGLVGASVPLNTLVIFDYMNITLYYFSTFNCGDCMPGARSVGDTKFCSTGSGCRTGNDTINGGLGSVTSSVASGSAVTGVLRTRFRLISGHGCSMGGGFGGA